MKKNVFCIAIVAFLMATHVRAKVMPLQVEVEAGKGAQPATDKKKNKPEYEYEELIPFRVGRHVFDVSGRKLIIAAAQEIQDEKYKKFTLAMRKGNEHFFTPLTPHVVRLNGKENIINPLYGASIFSLVNFGRNLAVVLEKEPRCLYVLEAFGGMKNVAITKTKTFNDAKGNPSAGIVAISSTASGIHNLTMDEISSQDNSTKIVVVGLKNQDGVFGSEGSGISCYGQYIKHVPMTESELDEAKNNGSKETTKSITFVHIPNVNDGSEEENKALPFDIRSEAVCIGSHLQSMENKLSLHFASRFGLFYAGIQGVGGSAHGDGIRALSVILPTVKSTLILREIAPKTVFAPGVDAIVGCAEPGARVSCHHIASMVTSTWLDYLVVVGGKGSPEDTSDRVYALPLCRQLDLTLTQKNKKKVSEEESKIHLYQYGYIANKLSIPGIFNNGSRRGFIFPATKPEEMTTASDTSAQVGCGPLGAPIKDIFTSFDTVFVSTDQPVGSLQPGIFYSQAYFDQYGRIAGWTPWHRYAAQGPIDSFVVDAHGSGAFYVRNDSNSCSRAHVVDFGKLAYHDIVKKYFPEDQGGVYSLSEIPFHTKGIATGGGRRAAFLALGGKGTIFMVQIGQDDQSGYFGPSLQYDTTFVSTDGSFKAYDHASLVTGCCLSGGALSEIGAIADQKIVEKNGYGYWVVAGQGGIAILSDDNGYGFNADVGLGRGFSGLSSSLRFRKLQGSSYIKKLFVSNGDLYAITENQLIKIDIEPQLTKKGVIGAHVILGKHNLPGFTNEDTIFDSMLLPTCGIAITSAGMYYSPAPEFIDVPWELIKIEKQYNSFDQMIVFGFRETNGQKGMLTLLNTSYETGVSQVIRVAFDRSNPVNKFEILADHPKKFGSSGFLINFGDRKKGIATDGVSTFVFRSQDSSKANLLQMYSPGLRAGVGLGKRSLKDYAVEIKKYKSVGTMIKSETTGQWLLIGDFGIRGNT